MAEDGGGEELHRVVRKGFSEEVTFEQSALHEVREQAELICASLYLIISC